MKKKCQYILLPTDKEHNGQGLYFVTNDSVKKEVLAYAHYGHNPQHLYILSDDKIKEGDWLLNTNLDINKTVPFKKNFKYDSNDVWYKKIIATTDPELLTGEFIDDGNQAGYGSYKDEVASISQSDIEYIVNLYNTNREKKLLQTTATDYQTLKDNVDKKFTLEDMKECFKESRKGNIFKNPITPKFISFTDYIQSLIKEQSNNNTLMVEYEETYNYIGTHPLSGEKNVEVHSGIYQPELRDRYIVIHKT